MLEFCFREKNNAANTPAQTMQSTPSIAYFASILAMSNAVVSTMFHLMPILYNTNLLNVDLLSQKFITVLEGVSTLRINFRIFQQS